MRTVTIAPHLQRALESMSKDLAVEPQALVNQAVFAWLRINGYVLPGAAQVAASPVVAPLVAPVVAPVAPVIVAPPTVAPEPATVALGSALPPPETTSMPSSPSLPRVQTPAPMPAAEIPHSSPSGEQLSAMARMNAIAADVEKLTKPWPAWAPEEPEDEQDEGESDEEEPVQDEAPPADDGEPEEEEKQPESNTGETAALGAEDQDEVEAPAGIDGNTGETEVEPPADSTVVLRSVPIVLYLEREGEDPVRVQADRFIIGRGPTCDLVIDSPRVSREHLAITRSGIRYFIEDLNSSNGTWFGEERVTKRELESGDVISLGNEPVTFILRAD